MPTSSWTSSLQVPVRATSKLTSRASHDNIKQEKTQLAKSLAIVNIHIYIYIFMFVYTYPGICVDISINPYIDVSINRGNTYIVIVYAVLI